MAAGPSQTASESPGIPSRAAFTTTKAVAAAMLAPSTSSPLGTAEGTVKNHASSILSKLGVRDRTRAVLRALELGYI
jgi:hypothetical protein